MIAAPDRARQQLDALRTANPEWRALLDLWAAVLDTADAPAWASLRVSPAAARPPGAPSLSGATIALPRGLAGHWLGRLGLGAVPDPIALLHAAIERDTARVQREAGCLALPVERLTVILAIATVPILTAAANRLRGEALPPWDRGCCPDCGAWPAIAEERGLERARRLRCVRCGGDWPLDPYRCPFCDARGHQHAGSLASEDEAATRRVATCARCPGYLKAMTTLRAWTPGEVAMADLATVDLDLAAITHDFARPPEPSTPLGLTLREEES